MAEAKVITNRPNSSSPPPNCAICLGCCTNKCFSDSCMHQFCFNCLLEWSKIKAECPLCKQPFKSIIHNVKSNDEYDEHVVENIPADEIHIIDNDFLYLPPLQPSRHQFHFRTTFTVDTRGEHAIQQMLLTHPLTNGGQIAVAGFSPGGSVYHRRRRDTSATSFRRSIYSRNLWVNAPPDVTGRYRDISPSFYRICPGARTRLVPWLNRELNALLYENTQLIMHLVDIIMENLLRHHICSTTFRSILYEYLNNKTDHFVHEFFNFMRSPYDMIGYDRHIIYTERPSSPAPYIDVSDNDSDVILVSATNPEEPVVIDLVNTDSDEPILVSTEGPPENTERRPEVEAREPILPLKLRLKHKRQSREKRNRAKKRHRHRSSSSSGSCSSSNCERESSYKRYKRRKKMKKHKSKKYIISSESEVCQVNNTSTDTDDNLPLAAFINKKKHKKYSKRKSSKSSKSYTETSRSAKDLTKHTPVNSVQQNSNLPGCSRYCLEPSTHAPFYHSNSYNRDADSEVSNSSSAISKSASNCTDEAKESASVVIQPLSHQSGSDVQNASSEPSSSSCIKPNYPKSNSDESAYEEEDNSYLRVPAVKSEIREVKSEDRNSAGPSHGGRLRNIFIKKEGSSNMWYSCPCGHDTDTD